MQTRILSHARLLRPIVVLDHETLTQKFSRRYMLYTAALYCSFILQLYTTVCLQAAAPSARYLEVHIERAVAVDERRVLPRGELAHP